MYRRGQESKIKIETKNRGCEKNRAAVAGIDEAGSCASRRLRLLNKSALSPGVHGTDDEGEGKEDGRPVGRTETLLSSRYPVVESVLHCRR